MNTVRTLQIEQIDAQTILDRFSSLEGALNEIKAHISPQQPNAFLTRQEVADIFKVTKVTIWDWTKKGLIKSYRIGNKVRYKESEVISAAALIKNKSTI
ncbi:helix-turn-helix domain-containing protein [Larkinella bovis]|uniref:Helix-turn-helix domain-containing protein n=1 Tax=Larkinella bovis TaxID=683041 RepID=A0ABW0IB07_9BACT